ncbi:hypothetical protein EDB86DRAFT_210971 [Lactarius hatsudake]|nr:hypothetical protein EDB86DRAFT_210971 [Lactarius hatsudake]
MRVLAFASLYTVCSFSARLSATNYAYVSQRSDQWSECVVVNPAQSARSRPGLCLLLSSIVWLRTPPLYHLALPEKGKARNLRVSPIKTISKRCRYRAH